MLHVCQYSTVYVQYLYRSILLFWALDLPLRTIKCCSVVFVTLIEASWGINTSSSSPVNNKRRRLPATSVTNLPRFGAAVCITFGGWTADSTRWRQISAENRDFCLPHLHSTPRWEAPRRSIEITFWLLWLHYGEKFWTYMWRSGDSPLLTSMDVIVYSFTVLCGFARWSILDCVGSRNVGGNSVRCIICCIDSGIFWTGIFEMLEVYITVDYAVDRSLSSGDVVSVGKVGSVLNSR